MDMIFTRHALSHIADAQKVSPEHITSISTSVEKTLSVFVSEFEPSPPNPFEKEQIDIARYFGEIDPLDLLDSELKNSDEYLVEAQASTWLFDNQLFSRETFWAIWIYFFSDELSPFKSQDDPLLVAMFNELSIIFRSRLTEDERNKLRMEAETPWISAGITAVKYQFSSEGLVASKRKKLRKD